MPKRRKLTITTLCNNSEDSSSQLFSGSFCIRVCSWLQEGGMQWNRALVTRKEDFTYRLRKMSVTRTSGMRQHRVADTKQGNMIYPRRMKRHYWPVERNRPSSTCRIYELSCVTPGCWWIGTPSLLLGIQTCKVL